MLRVGATSLCRISVYWADTLSIWLEPLSGEVRYSFRATKSLLPKAVKRRISRRALFARDGWRCVYCGTSSGRLTLDHVVPRSRGGDSAWENVVTACSPCNLRKGDRLLDELRMTLPKPPKAPTPVLFIRLALPRVPESWMQYLPSLDHGEVAA